MNPLYKPFEKFSLTKCFLSGKPVASDETITVFPEWFMKKFDLYEKPFKLLDESYTTYGALKLPCSLEVRPQLDELNTEIMNAFEKGYSSVIELDEFKIFQWLGLIMYGLVYKEIENGLTTKNYDEPFQISPALLKKFSNHHLFIQSLINKKIVFEDFKPFSIFIFKIDNPEHELDHRSEINTLTFSLRMNDFGIICCMQDNGSAKKFYAETNEKIKDQTLHLIQFQEFCAQVFYSSYLFNRIPDYYLLETPDEISINAETLAAPGAKPVYDEWQPKVYAQVLEALWKKWNIHLMQILKDPAHPMTFLDKDISEIDLPQ
jgi:hypothetical protein